MLLVLVPVLLHYSQLMILNEISLARNKQFIPCWQWGATTYIQLSASELIKRRTCCILTKKKFPLSSLARHSSVSALSSSGVNSRWVLRHHCIRFSVHEVFLLIESIWLAFNSFSPHFLKILKYFYLHFFILSGSPVNIILVFVKFTFYRFLWILRTRLFDNSGNGPELV